MLAACLSSLLSDLSRISKNLTDLLIYPINLQGSGLRRAQQSDGCRKDCSPWEKIADNKWQNKGRPVFLRDEKAYWKKSYGTLGRLHFIRIAGLAKNGLRWIDSRNKKNHPLSWMGRFQMAPETRLELVTCRLTAGCSTDWAIQASADCSITIAQGRYRMQPGSWKVLFSGW